MKSNQEATITEMLKQRIESRTLARSLAKVIKLSPIKRAKRQR